MYEISDADEEQNNLHCEFISFTPPRVAIYQESFIVHDQKMFLLKFASRLILHLIKCYQRSLNGMGYALKVAKKVGSRQMNPTFQLSLIIGKAFIKHW